MIQDPLIKIASIGELHHYAQSLRLIIKKCLFVSNNILMPIANQLSQSILNLLNGCQNSNFIQCILLLFLCQLTYFNLQTSYKKSLN